ncbi:cytochrome c heme-lyase, partial [Phenoliferia sp. Uapishka_3]
MWPFSPSPSPSDPVAPSACPVDPSTRQAWIDANPGAPPPTGQSRPLPPTAEQLSRERVVSTIPRWLPADPSSTPPTDPTACPARSAPVDPSATPTPTSTTSAKPPRENWVYPSPSSFYTALERKQRTPDAADMPIVVPIHNAVNERVWEQVLEWEKEAAIREGRDASDLKRDVSLVSFVGKPKELSPRARWKSLIGYSPPFDRHDWTVDRALPTNPSDPTSPESMRIRYVIDFYTGRLPAMLSPDRVAAAVGSGPGSEDNFRPNLSFFLDVRPALDGWEGVRMRGGRFWNAWFGAKEEGQSK